MRLRFTKMQGAGNDFVMLDGIGQALDLTPARVRALADRRFGVGADMVLVAERPTDPQADFRYRIYNGDGGEVEQCGNGARCFVMFVRGAGLTSRTSIRVQTACGLIEPSLLPDGTVCVDMGPPSLAPADSGFDPDGLASRRLGRAPQWALDVAGREVWISVVSMGNPHAVQRVEDVDAAPVTSDGPAIERHPRFAQGVNAGFMQVAGPHEIRLRVWERGVGETLACGTGACAAVVAGIEQGILRSPVDVRARGGTLRVAWDRPGDGGDTGAGAARRAPVMMSGPAVKVFEGEIDVE
jgi:diaminopimelate epimerase